MSEEKIKLTQYSHGGGCGCKIAPKILDEILEAGEVQPMFENLLVGNKSRDDAAVYSLNDKEALISTTDFFTPIVDDAYTFGQTAAANAISDIYAMGGEPLLALAILGWPINKLPVEEAQRMMEGARFICAQAGIPLAGGHSIDTTEPVFGLSVNGRVLEENLKRNDTANEGDTIWLTKPLGIGILSAAMKRGVLSPAHEKQLISLLTCLNSLGAELGKLDKIHAMTDVTGFGLAGHLIEMAEGAGLSAELEYEKIPKIKGLETYLSQNIIPDATYRNWNAVGNKTAFAAGVNTLEAFQILPDPQTNGGLLISVAPEGEEELKSILKSHGLDLEAIGKFVKKTDKTLKVN